MIQRIITKYGLAMHLALLAAGPLAVDVFYGPFAAAIAAFCLSAFAIEWFLFSPSIHSGEEPDDARRRVAHGLLRDPVFYFFLAAVLFALARALNSGLAMVYDLEKSVWSISSPKVLFLPSAAGDWGLVLLAAVIAIAVVVLGIRHGLGHAARTFCVMAGAGLSGLAGLVAAVMACCGMPDMVARASRGLFDIVFCGDVFGLWLLVSIAAGGVSESLGWRRAGRAVSVVAVAGNTAGLVFFAPPVVAAWYLLLAICFAIFIIVFIGIRVACSSGFLALAIAGVSMAFGVLLLAVLAPDSLRDLKASAALPASVFTDSFGAMRSTLSRLARGMWVSRPWCGVGAGAFGLNARFLATQADWAVLPPHPAFVPNGYLMLLAERGIVGCGMFVAGFAMLIASYVIRFGRGARALRANPEGLSIVFGFSPFVWVAPLMLLALLAEAFVAASPVCTMASLVVLALAFAVSTVSFPRVICHPAKPVADPAAAIHSEK